jgi:hypothetical protein
MALTVLALAAASVMAQAQIDSADQLNRRSMERRA